MRKLKEVLRLRYELKLGYQQIGRSCAIGVSTVHKYLKRAEAAALSWPLPEDWDEARVEGLVFPRREPSIAEHNPARTRPDFAAICGIVQLDGACHRCRPYLLIEFVSIPKPIIGIHSAILLRRLSNSIRG